MLQPADSHFPLCRFSVRSMRAKICVNGRVTPASWRVRGRGRCPFLAGQVQIGWRVLKSCTHFLFFRGGVWVLLSVGGLFLNFHCIFSAAYLFQRAERERGGGAELGRAVVPAGARCRQWRRLVEYGGAAGGPRGTPCPPALFLFCLCCFRLRCS